jgi:L-arabinose transport system substrate-binding protein
MEEKCMKKIFATLCVFSLLAGAVFAGGGKQAAPAVGGAATSDGQLFIAGIYKAGDQTWFINEGKASGDLVQAAGAKWQYMDAKMDGATYMNLLDNVIAQGVKGLLICIPDQNLSQATMTKLKAANIPVIAVDDALQDESGKLLAPWVGIDAYNIGMTAGQWGADWVKKNNLQNDSSFGILYMTTPTVSSIVPRTEAQKKAIADAFPSFPASRQFDAPSDATPEQGNTAAAAVITAHPEIKKWLVFGINDETATGAARALEAAGHTAKTGTMVIGFGGYLAKDEYPKADSPFKAAVYFSAKMVGETAAQQMIDFLTKGTPIPERKAASAIMVLPTDNLREVMPENF